MIPIDDPDRFKLGLLAPTLLFFNPFLNLPEGVETLILSGTIYKNYSFLFSYFSSSSLFLPSSIFLKLILGRIWETYSFYYLETFYSWATYSYF